MPCEVHATPSTALPVASGSVAPSEHESHEVATFRISSPWMNATRSPPTNVGFVSNGRCSLSH